MAIGNRRATFGLLVALLPGVALARDYSYVEGAVLRHEDTDATDHIVNRGNNLIGYRATLQLALPTRPFAGFAEYDQTDVLEHWSVGALTAIRVGAGLDFTAGTSVEFEDLTDEKGYGLRAGLRWLPLGPRLEIAPQLRYEELFNAQTSVRLSAMLQVYGRWSAGAVAQGGDDERLAVGLRYAL